VTRILDFLSWPTAAIGVRRDYVASNVECSTHTLALSTSSPTTATLSDSGDYLSLAKRHYENFPVGSWLLPKVSRLHLHRIYAFARTADDLADELQDRVALQAFRRDFLRHQPGGEGTESARDIPLFVELWQTIAQCQLEVSLFTDLLDAFDQDCHQRRYDRPQLLDYCRRSADPIGRLVLRVSGYRDAKLDAYSDRVCTGLQLLNHLQDLREDLLKRDRIYFPIEELTAAGAHEQDLRAATASPAVKRFVLQQADLIAADFAAGWPIIDGVSGRLRLELRAILHGAAGVLRLIRAADGDVMGGKVHLSKLQRVRTVFAGLLSGREPHWGGK
jgi:hydroxysqualene synthase